LPRKQQEWEEDLKKFGMNVEPAEVISREMERYMPSYLFLVLDPEPPHERGEDRPEGRVAFYTRDDRPFAVDEDGGMHWYRIPAENLPYVRFKVKELVPTVEVRDGVEGYVVPLQESPSFDESRAVVSYQRNLMFWESMLSDDGYGPMSGRYAFLARAAYRASGEHRETVIVRGAKKQGKTVYPRARYRVVIDCKEEQERHVSIRERLMEWLETSEHDKREAALLHERMKQQLEKLQQIYQASERSSKKRNDPLKKVSRGMIGKRLR